MSQYEIGAECRSLNAAIYYAMRAQKRALARRAGPAELARIAGALNHLRVALDYAKQNDHAYL